MSEWQPIETAPTGMNAPPVLVWNGDEIMLAFCVVPSDGWLSLECAHPLAATHWMPLPEPPKA